NKWDVSKIKSTGLSKKLDSEHPFFLDLHRAYADYLNSKTALINKKLEFYNSISYSILEENQDPIQIKLKVGDFVELLEETEGIAYAKIEYIFQHQANNDQYHAFFLFNWFQATNKLDPILGCPLYNIQEPEDSRWLRIFPINFVDHTPCVHFIHNCTNTCMTNKHDETNQ
ncbi:15517_t:CDS:1, partial [Dentiscutata heterogama]